MAYLAKEYVELEEQTFNAYSRLDSRLWGLISYVKRHLPENAEEVLFGNSFDTRENELFPEMSFEETYILTRGGIREIKTEKISL